MDNFKRIARFEIVSFDQFKNSFEDKNDDEIIKALFASSAVGVIIGMNATMAGAEGGCHILLHAF